MILSIEHPVLDNLSMMKNLDPEGQLKWISQWHTIFTEAFKYSSSIEIPKKIEIGMKRRTITYNKNFSAIVITGMGGSAISGDYISTLLSHMPDILVPVIINRGYDLPAWVSETTLMIGISYSGNTRETLSCVYQAFAKNIPLILASAGGLVQEIAEKYSIPWIKLPAGYQPRAAFPVLFGSLLGILSIIFPQSNIKYSIANVSSAISKYLDDYGPQNPTATNLAKQIALSLYGKFPVIISSVSALGMRWKGQMNENAKSLAIYDVFPESMHNSIQGWETTHQNINDFVFIILKLSIDSLEIVEKVSYCLQIANSTKSAKLFVLEFKNTSLIEGLVGATLTGDLISLYLAFIQEINPSTIRLINAMKKEFEPKLASEFDLQKALLNL